MTTGAPARERLEAVRPNLLVVGFLLAATAFVVGSNVAGTGLTIVGVGLAAAIIIMKRPDAATILVLFALYTNAAVVAVHFHNVPAMLAVVLPMALTAPLAYHVLIRRGRIVLTPTLPWMLGLLAAQILSTMASAHVGDGLNEITNFAVEGIGLFLLVVNVVRSPQMLRAACWSILAAGAFLGLLSGYQELTGTYGNSYFGFAQVKDAAGGFFTGEETLLGRARQPELAGPIGDQNFYAQIMLMLVPIGMARALAERGVLALLALGLTLLVGVGLVMTFSRGAAVSAVILAVGMVVIRFISLRHVLIGLAILVAVSVAVPEYLMRIATLDVAGWFVAGEGVIYEADVSLQSRATENLAAGLVFLDHPIVGVGPGQFPLFYQEYANRIGLEVQLANRQPHSLYLGIAAELGTLGLVAFLGILAVTVVNLFRARRQTAGLDPALSITLTGLALSIGAFMLTGLFLHLAYARYAWLVIALAAAGVAIAREVVQAAPRTPARAAAALDASSGP